MTGGTEAQMFQAMLLGPLVSMSGKRQMGNLLVKPSKKDLMEMSYYLEAGEIVPVIDRIYPLSKLPEAIAYLEEGHAQGKVIISMDE
ncbi:zinc-binding dehydrogenase [Baia soyae]